VSDLPECVRGARAAAPHRARFNTGLLYGVGCYTLWGFFPIYFHALGQVQPLVVLCHRIVWSVALLAGVVAWRHEWGPVWQALRKPRSLALLSAAAVLIAVNWLIFIYAVSTKQVLQSSLGYFINPLVSIALGMFFLNERLRPWQWAAVLLAVVAVGNLAFRGTGFPWIAVSLACTFGLYGLVRKKVDTNSLHALLIETGILFPLSLLLLLVLPGAHVSSGTLGILSLSGVITAVPLLMFGAALRRLRLSTIGFLQYIGPSLQFAVAVFLFHEHLNPARLLSFALCWAAIGVYVVDSALKRSAAEPEPALSATEP
jgi:chloramphenicol-sensitive protein RarD